MVRSWLNKVMIEEKVELLPEYEGKWAAVYLPALPDSSKDPSRYDLESKDAAEEYVFSRMCRDCREGRERILNGTSDPDNNEDHLFDSLWPGCACEWEVMPTQSYAQCESFGDIMTAVGAKIIYQKDDAV